MFNPKLQTPDPPIYEPDVDDGSDDWGTEADDMTGIHETIDPS